MINYRRTPNQLGNLLGPQMRQPYLPGANVSLPSPGWSAPFIPGVTSPAYRQPRPLPTQPTFTPAPGIRPIPGVPNPAYRQPRGGQLSSIAPRPISAFPTPTPGIPMTSPYTPQTPQMLPQLQNFMPQLQQFMTMMPQLQQIMNYLPQLMNLLNLLGGGR